MSNHSEDEKKRKIGRTNVYYLAELVNHGPEENTRGSVSDSEILRVFVNTSYSRRIYATSEIAEQLPIGDEAVRQRLWSLEGEHLATEKLGKDRVWWLHGVEPFAGKSTVKDLYWRFKNRIVEYRTLANSDS